MNAGAVGLRQPDQFRSHALRRPQSSYAFPNDKGKTWNNRKSARRESNPLRRSSTFYRAYKAPGRACGHADEVCLNEERFIGAMSGVPMAGS